MPYRSNTSCKHPLCKRLVPYGSRYCEEHEKLHTGDRSSSGKRGYNTKWQKARKRFLAANPLCVKCKAEGKYVKATVVDHIIPHRGDPILFWKESNWQPLCKHHHDRKTMTEDRHQEYRY